VIQIYLQKLEIQWDVIQIYLHKLENAVRCDTNISTEIRNLSYKFKDWHALLNLFG
jgi:hypothetical protein